MSEPRAELEAEVVGRRTYLARNQRGAAESIGWVVCNGFIGGYYLSEGRTGLALLSLAVEVPLIRDTVVRVMAASHQSKVLVGMEQHLVQDTLRAVSEPVLYDQEAAPLSRFR